MLLRKLLDRYLRTAVFLESEVPYNWLAPFLIRFWKVCGWLPKWDPKECAHSLDILTRLSDQQVEEVHTSDSYGTIPILLLSKEAFFAKIRRLGGEIALQDGQYGILAPASPPAD